MPIALLLMLLLSPLAPQVAHSEEWTTYVDEEAGFSVSYPVGWEVDATPMSGAGSSIDREAKLMIRSSRGDQECLVSHGRPRGLHVSAELILSAFKPNKWIARHREQYGHIQVVESSKRMLSGISAAYLELLFESDGHSKHSKMYYLGANGGSYLVSCDVPPANSEMDDFFTHFRILGSAPLGQ